jgi:ring-1,2-phenylacetyl-CoA epoxidase subunit PaaC
VSGVGATEPQAGDAGVDGGSRDSPARAQLLLALADDELILGWRDSEWTGIAPTLEEDVAFSSIAQNEIGHARALYELAVEELDTDADALAFDRDPADYACAPLVELRLLDDWAMTIARRYLYEQADRVRITALISSSDAELAGLAAKIDREEVYHRLHAELWADRLRGEPRFEAAVDELWPYALGMLPPEQRDELALRVGRPAAGNGLSHAHARGGHSSDLEPLWLEMTEVRRSIPGAQW